MNFTDADLRIIQQAMYKRMFDKPFTPDEQRVYDEIDQHLNPENWLENNDGLVEDEYMERLREA